MPEVDPTTDFSPSQDPAYLAFLRAQGYTEAQARADAARRTGVLDRQLAAALPGYADQERLGLEQVAGNAESSGVLNSGKTLVDEQQVSTDVGRQRTAYQTGITDQQAQIQSDLERQIALLRQQAAEQALNARQNNQINAAQPVSLG